MTIAGIIIDSQFSDLLDDDVWANLRKAMYIAVDGDGYRVGGFNDDNLRPAYSNVSYLAVFRRQTADETTALVHALCKCSLRGEYLWRRKYDLLGRGKRCDDIIIVVVFLMN